MCRSLQLFALLVSLESSDQLMCFTCGSDSQVTFFYLGSSVKEALRVSAGQSRVFSQAPSIRSHRGTYSNWFSQISNQ
jgi:hypothetical protein